MDGDSAEDAWRSGITRREPACLRWHGASGVEGDR
jgi:hypothetical protein